MKRWRDRYEHTAIQVPYEVLLGEVLSAGHDVARGLPVDAPTLDMLERTERETQQQVSHPVLPSHLEGV